MVKETNSQRTTSEISGSLVDRIDGWISLVLKIMLIIGAVLEALQGNWLNSIITTGIVILAFTPLMMGYQFNVRIPSEFELLAVVFIYASLVLGDIYGFYTKYWWWDILLHASSGLILGILGFLLVHVLNEHENLKMHMKPSFVSLFAFMFAVGMGTLWEVVEFAMDQFFGMNTQGGSLVDTMGDLVVDCIGALIISVYGFRYLLSTHTDSFLKRWIQHFILLNRHFFSRRKHKKTKY
jgi:hypothetical protein